MTVPLYSTLESVIADELFPAIDMALRQGRHVAVDDAGEFALLRAAQALLEAYYRRYGCELVESVDGYFYLRPNGERLARRHLSAGEMLVGQALALLYLDPATVQSGGAVHRGQIIELLDNLVGKTKLVQALNRRMTRQRSERTAQEQVRKEVDKALRTLAGLGFIELRDGETLRLRSPVMRFADAVRGLGDPGAGLRRLIERGDAVEAEAEAAASGEDPAEDEP